MALDPVLQQMLDQIPAPTGGELDIPALREMASGMVELGYGPEGPIPVASVENMELTGSDGALPVRIFRPFGTPEGTLHYLYGGGWSVGNIDMIEPIARRLTRDLSMVVVTSGYRLAPENPFPAGFDDVMAASQWVLGHSSELGGNDRPVVICGESAGANLAAAVAMARRDAAADRNFDAQLLFFPAVDLRDTAADYPSRHANADPTLRSEALPPLYNIYGGGHDLADPRISPAAAQSLEHLPPAVVVVLTVDPLRDEAVAYAKGMRNAGVTVDLIEFEHLVHGFPGFSALVPAAAEATATVLDHLKALLARTTTMV